MVQKRVWVVWLGSLVWLVVLVVLVVLVPGLWVTALTTIVIFPAEQEGVGFLLLRFALHL